MREEYKDIRGFDFYFDRKGVNGDYYQIYKDGKEICEEAFTFEWEIFDWAAEHEKY